MNELFYQLRWALPLWLVNILTNWLPENRITISLRGVMARPFIKNCGKGFALGKNVTILNSHNLIIGDHVYIAQGCWFNCLGGLTIESESILAPYVVISTLQHVFNNDSVRFGGSISSPVKIGKGAWIASHVSVKCGVSIGKGSIIAANAAVTKDIPEGVVAGGVPAKVIKGNNNDQKDYSHIWFGRDKKE